MFMKRHVLSMREFSRDEIDSILDLAVSLEPYARGKDGVDLVAGKLSHGEHIPLHEHALPSQFMG